MTTKPRIWISNRTPAQDEVVTVRAMVAHVMETGLRRDSAGELVPRNMINRFDCMFDGETILSWQLDTAVSRNPFLEFRFRARKTGDLQMVWTGDQNARIEAETHIEVVT